MLRVVVVLASVITVAVVMSDSESEYEFPENAFCSPTDEVAASRCSFNTKQHFVIDDVDSEPEECRSTITPEVSFSGRGHHSRERTVKRESHADQARRYYLRIKDTCLAGGCRPDCASDCENILGRNQMLECLEISYGTTS